MGAKSGSVRRLDVSLSARSALWRSVSQEMIDSYRRWYGLREPSGFPDHPRRVTWQSIADQMESSNDHERRFR